MDPLGESTASGDRIERLFSLLNHELRTPITCLQGSLDLLQTGNLGEMNELGQSVLKLANDSVDRLSQLINNLLIWFELTYPEHPLFKEPCDITQLITQITEDLESLTTQHQVQICIHFPVALSLMVDRVHLTYALQHLLRYAIHCSLPDRSIQIQALELTQVEAAPLPMQTAELAPPFALLSIQDEGICIPDHELATLFQPLPQLTSLEDWQYGDLGLELALCHQIIRHHDGMLWVDRVVDQGNTFYIALPTRNQNSS
jgi:signal transduction histidine kinase